MYCVFVIKINQICEILYKALFIKGYLVELAMVISKYLFKDKFHFSHKKNATLSSSILIFLNFSFN